jgi:hypothetical protein
MTQAKFEDREHWARLLNAEFPLLKFATDGRLISGNSQFSDSYRLGVVIHQCNSVDVYAEWDSQQLMTLATARGDDPLQSTRQALDKARAVLDRLARATAPNQ